MQSVHIPILCKTIVSFLTEKLPNQIEEEKEKQWILDCTFGGGGHSRALLEELSEKNLLNRFGVLGVDQDISVIKRAQENFINEIKLGQLEVHHCPMSQASGVLKKRPIVGILADLGFSSDQIEDPARGLSFLREGPLDMRLNQNQNITAYELLCSLSQIQLEKIISEYGEDRFSRVISSKIIESRKKKQLPKTTLELAKLIESAVPSSVRYARIHPATKTFQALRIAVNSELEELDTLLESVILLLGGGGRGALLTFHSLEDRKVKTRFKDLMSQGGFKVLTKKPIIPNEDEQAQNPRSRSAKLRVIEKCL